jgi:hypothetical protein
MERTPSKILIACQSWEGDNAQAMRLARLIADLEPRHSDRADFFFCYRFDCKPDKATEDYVSSKFNVFSWVNRHRRGEGWPGGCNDLWFGTMDRIYDLCQAGQMPEYKAVLTCEADSSPLVPHWINSLHSEWDKMSQKEAKLVGHLLQYPPQPQCRLHCNGNALFSGDLTYLHHLARKIGGCPPSAGWDFYLAPQLQALGWADSPAIRSYWNAQTAQVPFLERVTNEGCVFLHGVKDYSVQEYVRNRYLLPRESAVIS